jgi:hypothetical protein
VLHIAGFPATVACGPYRHVSSYRQPRLRLTHPAVVRTLCGRDVIEVDEPMPACPACAALDADDAPL